MWDFWTVEHAERVCVTCSKHQTFTVISCETGMCFSGLVSADFLEYVMSIAGCLPISLDGNVYLHRNPLSAPTVSATHACKCRTAALAQSAKWCSFKKFQNKVGKIVP